MTDKTILKDQWSILLRQIVTSPCFAHHPSYSRLTFRFNDELLGHRTGGGLSRNLGDLLTILNRLQPLAALGRLELTAAGGLQLQLLVSPAVTARGQRRLRKFWQEQQRFFDDRAFVCLAGPQRAPREAGRYERQRYLEVALEELFQPFAGEQGNLGRLYYSVYPSALIWGTSSPLRRDGQGISPVHDFCRKAQGLLWSTLLFSYGCAVPASYYGAVPLTAPVCVRQALDHWQRRKFSGWSLAVEPPLPGPGVLRQNAFSLHQRFLAYVEALDAQQLQLEPYVTAVMGGRRPLITLAEGIAIGESLALLSSARELGAGDLGEDFFRSYPALFVQKRQPVLPLTVGEKLKLFLEEIAVFLRRAPALSKVSFLLDPDEALIGLKGRCSPYQALACLLGDPKLLRLTHVQSEADEGCDLFGYLLERFVQGLLPLWESDVEPILLAFRLHWGPQSADRPTSALSSDSLRYRFTRSWVRYLLEAFSQGQTSAQIAAASLGHFFPLDLLEKPGCRRRALVLVRTWTSFFLTLLRREFPQWHRLRTFFRRLNILAHQSPAPFLWALDSPWGSFPPVPLLLSKVTDSVQLLLSTTAVGFLVDAGVFIQPRGPHLYVKAGGVADARRAYQRAFSQLYDQDFPAVVLFGLLSPVQDTPLFNSLRAAGWMVPRTFEDCLGWMSLATSDPLLLEVQRLLRSYKRLRGRTPLKKFSEAILDYDV